VPADLCRRGRIPVLQKGLTIHKPFGQKRSANAEAFGKAWDAWRDAQSDSTSLAAKLQARFNACGELNEARRSYDIYK